MKDAVINLSICLSDIPKDKIKVSQKNGKKYLQIVVRGRKEPDQFGNDITSYVEQTKEERTTGAARQYVGAGKYKSFTNMPPEDVNAMETSTNNDDLPF